MISFIWVLLSFGFSFYVQSILKLGLVQNLILDVFVILMSILSYLEGKEDAED